MTKVKLKQMVVQIKTVVIKVVQLIRRPLTIILEVQSMTVEILLLIQQITRSNQTPNKIAKHKQMTMPHRMMLKLPPMKIQMTEEDLQIQRTMMLPPIRQTTIQEVMLIRQRLTIILKKQQIILKMKRQ